MNNQQTLQQQLKQASSKIRRLLLLLSRYKEAYTIQGALLQLSELASHISDMADFYPAIHKMVSEQLHAENFYVVLYDNLTEDYRLQYFSDEKDQQLIRSVPNSAFSRGLTGYVVRQQNPCCVMSSSFRS